MTDPDLTLGPFSIAVHGRQVPNASDFWDANWLLVTAAIDTHSARVEASGAILRNSEVEEFRRQLEELIESGVGYAKLNCLEPNLAIETGLDNLGHADVEIVITPDHLSQSHTFRLALDQTYLSPLRSACASILRRYPIIGA